ncbi:MAG: YARHG domain-containing protein [Bacteroidales bacterium]|nr:YARHG domain-containing protein [Bacteroidales bacterium]
MMKRFAISVMLLLSVLTATANDGTYYTKGNQLVPLQETSISVRKEVLTISLMDNGYARVDVQYEFWNPEPTVRRLLMGFEANPPYNFDYKFYADGRHPSISQFTVEMNGQALSYRNAACVADTLPMVRIDTSRRYYVWDNNWLYEDDGRDEPLDFDKGIPFAYVYYFEAAFQPGLNRVHHSYVYKMSTNVGSPFIVEYKLTPAARWAGGKIEDFTLTIRADSTAKHFYVFDSVFGGTDFTVSEGMGKTRRATCYGDPCAEVSLRNGAITLHATDFRPTGELTIRAVGVDGCYVGKQCIAGGTYDRSARIDWGPYGGMQWVPADAAFRRRVMRNLPYAHRGHVFADKRLREYFESLWWYMPDPNYKDDTSDFSPIDWEFENYKED